MKIEENVFLREFTAFRTGGPARYFARVKNIDDLKEAVRFAKKKKLPFFILGRGANVLVSDRGFSGVALKMEMKGIEYKESGSGGFFVAASAGEDWDSFVSATVKRGLIGLENLSLIPGTVGASAFGNIGAYGTEAKDHIFSVEALNSDSMKIKKFSGKDCRFGYRESFFKTKIGKKYIITRVIFALDKKNKLKTDYKDAQEYFSDKKIFSPNQKNMRDAIIEIRKKKLPDIELVGTAGSFFKNPAVSKRKACALKKEYHDLPFFVLPEGKIKIPAAFLLDKICGFKGYKKGNIGTWPNQALVLVNYGGGTAEEILSVAREMEQKVKEKTGIDLQREVQVIK